MYVDPAETLARIGGIASIRDALIDDCALAARVKSGGGRVWLGISEPGDPQHPPLWGIAGIRAMIARSAFAQLRHSTLLLIGAIAGMMFTYIAPSVLLLSGDKLAGVLGLQRGSSAQSSTPQRSASTAHLSGRGMSAMIAIFYLIATIESAFRYWTRSGGLWKGRIQDT